MKKPMHIGKSQNHCMASCSRRKHLKASDLIISATDSEKDSCQSFLTKNVPQSSTSFELISEKNLWIPTLNSVRFLLRECTVILILVETVILLLGYCVLLGMHLALSYGYLFVRGKKGTEYNPDFNENRLDQQLQEEVYYQPVALPRGRMSRG